MARRRRRRSILGVVVSARCAELAVSGFHVVLALWLPGPLRKQRILLPPERRLGLVSWDAHRRRPLHVRRIARHLLLSLRRSSVHIRMLLPFRRRHWSLLQHSTHPPPVSARRTHCQRQSTPTSRPHQPIPSPPLPDPGLLLSAVNPVHLLRGSAGPPPSSSCHSHHPLSKDRAHKLSTQFRNNPPILDMPSPRRCTNTVNSISTALPVTPLIVSNSCCVSHAKKLPVPLVQLQIVPNE